MKETKLKKSTTITIVSVLSVIGVITGIVANISEIQKNKAERKEAEKTLANDSVVSESDSTNEIISEYEPKEELGAPSPDYQPKVVKLTDLNYFNAEEPLYIASPVNDNLEQTHASALSTVTNGTDGFYITDGYLQYYLNKKYTQLSGTSFLTYSARATNDETIIEFCGDGVVLESYSFTGGSVPQEFDLDVSNVEVLQISYHSNGTAFVGIDATLTKAE